jgi:hypothetical protein
MSPPPPGAEPAADPPAGAGAGAGIANIAEDHPLVSWLLTLPIAAVWVFLAQAGGEDLETTAREEGTLVAIATIVYLASGVVMLISRRERRRKRYWYYGSIVLAFVALGIYTVAANAAHPTPSVEIGVVPDRQAGTAEVTVTADHMRDKQKLVVRADWGEPYSEGLGHRDGKATEKFTAGPVTVRTRLRIVGFVKGADDGPPQELTCGDYPPCGDYDKTLAAPLPPNLHTALTGRRLTMTIPLTPGAPDQVIVGVLRNGRLFFKEGAQINSEEYKRTITLDPSAGPDDRVCVLATYDAGRIETCERHPAVSHKEFAAPK